MTSKKAAVKIEIYTSGVFGSSYFLGWEGLAGKTGLLKHILQVPLWAMVIYSDFSLVS